MAARKPKIVYTWVNGEVRWSFFGSDGHEMCASSNGFKDKHAAWWDVVRTVSAMTGGAAAPAVGAVTNKYRAVLEVGPGRKPKWSTSVPPPPFPDLRRSPPDTEAYNDVRL